MARRCYILKVGKKAYKLRLTLAGQKKIREYDPNSEIIGTIMSAISDPGAMDVVLTQALSWDGNENDTNSGEELYDQIVDECNGGQEYFAKLLLGIAENAGLMTEDQRKKMERRVVKMLKSDDQDDDPDDDMDLEEGESDPLERLPTL